jgi:ribosomal protein S18 acetylase RimI-like enzyme
MDIRATLRCAEPSDLERLVELFIELANYDIALGQRRPLRWTLDPAGPRSRFSQALRNPSEHLVVVVDQHDNVVGTCHTSLKGEGHPCPAHVHTLILDEAHRGQGLGRMLLDDAFDWCAENDVDEVSLDVAPRSTRSRRFYQRYGFEEASVLLIKKVEG